MISRVSLRQGIYCTPNLWFFMGKMRFFWPGDGSRKPDFQVSNPEFNGCSLVFQPNFGGPSQQRHICHGIGLMFIDILACFFPRGEFTRTRIVCCVLSRVVFIMWFPIFSYNTIPQIIQIRCLYCNYRNPKNEQITIDPIH